MFYNLMLRLTNLLSKKYMERETSQIHSGAVRKARLERAVQFLDERLLPRIQQDNPPEQKEIDAMVSRFRKEHPDAGESILERVWLEAKQRDLVNDCLAKEAPALVPTNAPLIKRCLELLSGLE